MPDDQHTRSVAQDGRGRSVDASGDPYLFGWDPTPGIVSVWADRDGQVAVWRRVGGRIACEKDRFRPWLFSTSLADVAHLGSALSPEGQGGAERGSAQITYRELEGPDDAYRFVLAAGTARGLERAILAGAGARRGRPVANLRELDGYHRVGPVEQYLMLTGRTYFRGLAYADLHRLQFDLETTSLDPSRGRIFMVAVRDNRGLATTLEAPAPEDERALITNLCALIRERDPDVIENHNLIGFDLPFLDGAGRPARGSSHPGAARWPGATRPLPRAARRRPALAPPGALHRRRPRADRHPGRRAPARFRGARPGRATA